LVSDFHFIVILNLSKDEGDLLVSKLSVDGRKGISASLNIRLVLTVEVYLHDTLSVNLDACALSSNLSGVDKIVQNSLVDGGQSARARTGSIGLLVAVERLSEDSALGDQENMAAREFLFQLTDKSLVHRFERFSQFVRNIDKNGRSSAAAVNFLGSSDVKIPEGCLELRGGHLKVEKLLGHRGFEFIGLGL
jgi:hypothetical protein